MTTTLSDKQQNVIFAIVDNKVPASTIEKIMAHSRFAIQNIETSKVVIGMRWESNQGVRFRPVFFKDSKITYGVARNSTFVMGIGIRLYDEVISPDLELAVNPVSVQEQERFEDIIRKCDFGTGESVTPTLFTDVV